MQRITRGVLFLILVLAAGRAWAEAPTLEQMQPWNPSGSYLGGAQSDPRLDQPVHFWRTAIPLAEVFAQVKQQTGVEVLCWPAGDQNERVRVNLYLNEQQPPTLRALLAQLAWVTDCSFACTEGEARGYYLLSARTGEVGAIAQRTPEEWQRLQREERQRALEQIRAKLEEYRGLLGLSREEVIARYQETDPMLLLRLLDPSRRAMLQFLLTLSPAQLQTFVEQRASSLRGEEMSPAAQELLATALHGSQEAIRASTVWIEIYASQSYTALSVDAVVPTHDGQTDRLRAPPFAAGDQQALGPRDEVDLRRVFGEEIDAEQAQALEDEYQAKRDREHIARENGDRVQKIRLAPELSAAAARRLSAFTAPAPFGEEARRPLWQVQEAVAKATGMHIISDYFAEASAVPALWLALLDPGFGAKQKQWNQQVDNFREAHPEEMAEIYGAGGDAVYQRFPLPTHTVSARDLLTAWCYGERPPQANPNRPWEWLGWEWGDAGDFLRFRSLCRDVWRSAMWPEDVVVRVNGWLAPYLPKGDLGKEPKVRDVPVRLRDLAWLAHRTDLQLVGGLREVYEDPSDPRGLIQAGFRAQVVDGMLNQMSVLRFLATLSDEQWELVQGRGLQLARDLGEQQRKLLPEVITGWADYQKSRGRHVRWDELVLKVVAAPSSTQPSSVDHYAVELWASGKKESDWHWPPIEAHLPAEGKLLPPLVLEAVGAR